MYLEFFYRFHWRIQYIDLNCIYNKPILKKKKHNTELNKWSGRLPTKTQTLYSRINKSQTAPPPPENSNLLNSRSEIPENRIPKPPPPPWKHNHSSTPLKKKSGSVHGTMYIYFHVYIFIQILALKSWTLTRSKREKSFEFHKKKYFIIVNKIICNF